MHNNRCELHRNRKCPLKPIIVLSLGGSLIVPNEIDVPFLNAFRDFVLSLTDKFRFIVVCGGGYTARKYIQAAKQITPLPAEELDWIGIKTTLLNAQMVKGIFPKERACQFVVHDPNEQFDFNEDVLVAGGWKPGCSTDFDAILLAKKFGCKKILNLSNITYAYDKDPKQFPDAKIIKNISWTDFRKIVGDKWDPGLNAPFDPIASKEAQTLGITVAILNGKNLGNLRKCILGKEFEGTLIDGK
jgi:uridylate kinase